MLPFFSVEESEWREILEKVKNMENKLIDLEEKTESASHKIKYTFVEASEISECFKVLTSIVTEQDEAILELETKQVV